MGMRKSNFQAMTSRQNDGGWEFLNSSSTKYSKQPQFLKNPCPADPQNSTPHAVRGVFWSINASFLSADNTTAAQCNIAALPKMLCSGKSESWHNTTWKYMKYTAFCKRQMWYFHKCHKNAYFNRKFDASLRFVIWGDVRSTLWDGSFLTAIFFVLIYLSV